MTGKARPINIARTHHCLDGLLDLFVNVLAVNKLVPEALASH